MTSLNRVATEPRLQFLEAVSTLPTWPGYLVLVLTILDGEVSILAGLLIPFWVVGGAVTVTAVVAGNGFRYRVRENPVHGSDIVLAACYGIGWLLIGVDMLLVDRLYPDLVLTWPGIAIAIIATGLLVPVVLGRLLGTALTATGIRSAE